MAALSDYLEGKLLNHIFRINSFDKPANISIALTSGIPIDTDDGSTIPEIPSGVLKGATFVPTNYTRVSLGDPSSDGNTTWNSVGIDDTTAYQVYSEEVGHSGYFYPLYLNELTAKNQDINELSTEYTFNNTFPGVTFHAPFSVQVSGGATDPGYTEYAGNGFIKNAAQVLFNTALTDWGWVSGIAILDSNIHGQGNLLMYSALQNPRIIYTGDSIKFDANSLEINLS